MEHTLLLVEDDRDTREMVSTTLDLAGFEVVACDSAESGLNALRAREFDLLLTDYSLPRHSGAWLLERAASEGLLDDTPAIIVTAHPAVEAGEEYEVIQKPFDIDDLIARVRRRVAGEKAGRRRMASLPKATPQGAVDGGGPGGPDPVELVLYVNAASKGDAAVESLRRILGKFNPPNVKLTVCPLPPTTPCVAGTDAPAAMVARPWEKAGPRTLILGHITDPEILLELLADCETGER